MVRLVSSLAVPQRTISSIVRKQPSHSPVFGFMVQMLMHGDGIGPAWVVGLNSFMNEICAAILFQGRLCFLVRQLCIESFRLDNHPLVHAFRDLVDAVPCGNLEFHAAAFDFDHFPFE